MTEGHARPDPVLQLMGATLRQYRQQRRLSHKALAARMGIRPSYISEIELGKRNIAVLMLLRLARALDIPLAWLLAQVDPHATLAPAVTAEPLPVWEAGVTPHDTTSLHPHDPETLLHLLGTTIRQYRQGQGLTQTGLAAKTGLDNWYLSQIEQGQRNLSTLSLVRIADGLGLAVSHLLRPLETYHNSSPTPE